MKQIEMNVTATIWYIDQVFQKSGVEVPITKYIFILDNAYKRYTLI